MNDVLAAAVWRKSTRSNSIGECVEVAGLADRGRAVRDSKNPTGPALMFPPAQWAVFTSAISRGRLG